MNIARKSPMAFVDISETEEDFAVFHIGYHDFKYVLPEKYPKVQKNYSLHFIFDGEGELNIHGKNYKLGQYDMFLIPPDVVVSYFPKEDNPWKYIWFDFSREKSDYYCKKIGITKNNPVRKAVNTEALCKLFANFLNDTENQIEIGFYHALSIFYSFIDILITPEKQKKRDIKELIISYIKNNYANEELSIEDICKYFSISHSYLCKIFHSSGGLKNVIIDIRLEVAKNHLEFTDLSVTDICYSVGFRDLTHFMKTFKKRTGMTATEYRNNFPRNIHNTKNTFN